MTIKQKAESFLDPELQQEEREELRSSLKAQEGEQYYNPLAISQLMRYNYNLLEREQNTPTQEQTSEQYIPYPLRINDNNNER